MVAVNRFIARRGRPATIISGNGTNFVASARELNESISSWNKNQTTSDLATRNIVWKFNLPGAAHFGGVWERLVRSCKKAIVSVLGNRSLTDELLTTIMCLVERTLNARPITLADDDLEDLEALTLNRFFLGHANVCIPFIPNAEVYSNHLRMFRSYQAYEDMNWQRCVREYLPQNNVRSHWNKSQTSIEVRDLVW